MSNPASINIGDPLAGAVKGTRPKQCASRERRRGFRKPHVSGSAQTLCREFLFGKMSDIAGHDHSHEVLGVAEIPRRGMIALDFADEVCNRNAIVEHRVGSSEAGCGVHVEDRVDKPLIVAFACADHQSMLAEAGWPGVGVGREMSNRQNRHALRDRTLLRPASE